MLNVANRMIIFERKMNTIVFISLIRGNKLNLWRLFTSWQTLKKTQKTRKHEKNKTFSKWNTNFRNANFLSEFKNGTRRKD